MPKNGNIKQMAEIVLFDDYEYLDLVISSIAQVLDEVVIFLNSRSWRGDAQQDLSVYPELERLKAKYANLRVVQGTWATDAEQRNAGLEYGRKNGFEFVWIVDSDEYHTVKSANGLYKALSKGFTMAGVVCSFDVYFKYLYKVQPKERFQPVVAVNPNKFVFTDKRSGKSTTGDDILQAHNLSIHHFSYARSDAYMAKKIAITEHSDQVLPNWWTDKWVNFTPDTKDLNPAWPKAYQSVVKVSLSDLPEELRSFFALKGVK